MNHEPEYVSLAVVLGHTQIVQTYGYDEEGRFCLGGYAIRYDENGAELSRSENVWNLRSVERTKAWLAA